MPDHILPLYGIQPLNSDIHLFGDGLINSTWKVSATDATYILQKVNHSVFKKPEYIDSNISRLNFFLKQKHPDYLFVSPLPDLSGNTLLHTADGYFRLFPFIKNSHSLNVLNKKEEAFEAAKQFGKFSHLLNEFDVAQLQLTLPDFHNLTLRFNQFLIACGTTDTERKESAKSSIFFLLDHKDIVQTFNHINEQKQIPERVIHHDTKINNVLFDQQHQGICVIDLDTVMPGYFISDVGDMMRTYLSAANEEETDLNKINIRLDFFMAIYDGYMQEMGSVLTEKEKSYFIYSGKFIIYMQAMRFLTDYLQQDIYYGQKYEGQNLKRAQNQIRLLEQYLAAEQQLEELINTKS